MSLPRLYRLYCQRTACSPFVYIDAHILATPSIADIDGDGTEELVVAVSYFYDRQYYEKEVRRSTVLRDSGAVCGQCGGGGVLLLRQAVLREGGGWLQAVQYSCPPGTMARRRCSWGRKVHCSMAQGRAMSGPAPAISTRPCVDPAWLRSGPLAWPWLCLSMRRPCPLPWPSGSLTAAPLPSRPARPCSLSLQEHRLELGKDLDLGWYVASGVVVFDLQRRSVKWSQVRAPVCVWEAGQGRVGRDGRAAAAVVAATHAQHGWQLRCMDSWAPATGLPSVVAETAPLLSAVPAVLQHLDLSTDFTTFKAYAYSGAVLLCCVAVGLCAVLVCLYCRYQPPRPLALPAIKTISTLSSPHSPPLAPCLCSAHPG